MSGTEIFGVPYGDVCFVVCVVCVVKKTFEVRCCVMAFCEGFTICGCVVRV